MQFKWLKRRRNTLAADSPRPNFADAPPLPSPTAQTAQPTRPSRRMSLIPTSAAASPSTPATEAPKIRRRKSFFQTLGLSKDKDKSRERERKRASSFGASPAPRFDKDVPPVPPLPNGTPISSQFQTPPSTLEPAPGRGGKRISLIPRKAPPSAWAGAADSPAESAPPLPPLPVTDKRQTMPAPRALPNAPGVSAVQLDDLPDSAEFSALDALDRLDAIGNLDIGLGRAQQNGAPPSSYGEGPRVSNRSSLPALNKALPSPSLAPPGATTKASKRMSLDPRARPPVIGAPDIDGVPVIKPTAAKMRLGDELPPPPPPAKEAAPSSGRKPVPKFEPEADPVELGVVSTPSPVPPTAESVPHHPQTSTTEGAYRLPPPAGVEMAPLPDVLNHPSAGYDGPRASEASAVSAPPATGHGSHAERKSELAYDQEQEPEANTPETAEGTEPEEPVAVGRRGVMGGPAKIQAVFASAHVNKPSRTESEPAPSEQPPAIESSEDAAADDPEESEQTPAQRYGIMGGPAKIESVWESSQAARDAREGGAGTEAEAEAEAKAKAKGERSEAGVEGEQEKQDDDGKAGQDEEEGKESDPTAGETEEMADDSASVTSEASAHPITTERLEHIRRPSSNWGASTEQLVDRPLSGMTDFGPRPPSGMMDFGRPDSSYTDFSSPPRPSAMDSNPHLLGTPSRRGIPSTQTFGSLPGTTTFGNLPRPPSLIEESANAAPTGSPLATLSESHSDATDATVTLRVDDVAPATPPRRPQSKGESGDVDVPDLYTPGTTPPSQTIHTPATSASHTRLPTTPTPSTPGVPFKATRSVSAPYKSPNPASPNKRSVSGGALSTPKDEPTLDDFMTIFRQVQKRGKGTGIGAAAAAAEGREYRQPRLGILEAQEASG